MTEITTDKGTFLFVECPSTLKYIAVSFDHSLGFTVVQNTSPFISWWHRIDGNPKDYQIMCTSRFIQGVRAIQILSVMPDKCSSCASVLYDGGRPDGFVGFHSPINAIKSLMKQKGLSENQNYAILKKL